MADRIDQGYLIHKAGDAYLLRGLIDGAVVEGSLGASATIQNAVDRLAGPGGEVVLSRGAFPLDAPVRLGDNVWPRGAGRGTRLEVTAANSEGVGLLCHQAKGVEISNLAVTARDNPDASAGIVIDDSGDCTVRDVFAVGFAEYGIWVRHNAMLCEVRGCTLAGNRGAGLFFEDLARGRYGNFVPNLATNCIVYGGGKGIRTSRAIVLNIVACVVYQSTDVAYAIENTSNSVLVSGCRSFQIGSHAVMVDHSDEFNLSSNIFCWHTGHGVLVRHCNWGTMTGNEVIDTGSVNPGTPDHTTRFEELPEAPPRMDGIRLEHVQGYGVTGNTVFNWPVAPPMRVGIWEDAASFSNTITGNNINYYEGADVISEGRETVVSGNVGHGPLPHTSPENAGVVVQSYQAELTARYIEELMA